IPTVAAPAFSIIIPPRTASIPRAESGLRSSRSFIPVRVPPSGRPAMRNPDLPTPARLRPVGRPCRNRKLTRTLRRSVPPLRLTSLEARTLPSAGFADVPPAKSLLDRGDFYTADGQQISLLERAGELVVRLATGDEARAVPTP